MTHLRIIDTIHNTTLAEWSVWSEIISLEGNWYVSPEILDLSSYSSKPKAYYCPVQQWYCTYYYLSDESGKPLSKEAFWVYESAQNPVYQHIVGWAGTYQVSMNNGLLVQ